MAVAVVGVARDVQCESGRARSPLVSCRELSSRVPRRMFSGGKSQTAIFSSPLSAFSVWAITVATRAEPSIEETPVRDSSFRAPGIARALLRVPSSHFRPRPRRDRSSRVARVTRRSGARTHAAPAPSTTPRRGGDARPGEKREPGRERGARAGTSFGWFVLPREAPRRRGRGRSRRDASDGDLPGRHERLPRSRCLPPR